MGNVAYTAELVGLLVGALLVVTLVRQGAQWAADLGGRRRWPHRRKRHP
jgi:membrane associated rhomboid family serine protease